MQKRILTSMLLTSIAGLTACGGETTSEPMLATFSLAVSDAPVTEAKAVVVCFTDVELTGNGLSRQRVVIGQDPSAANVNNLCRDNQGNVVANARGIDLLTLPGAKAEALVSQAELPPGNYGQLRLAIAEGSYVELLDGSRQALRVPSNELKLGGVTLSAGGTFSYTLEFDLRKAMVNPPGQNGYLLKPTGLRLVDDSAIGHLTGQVSETLLINNNCTVAPADKSEPVATVYLYAGADRPLAELSDNGGNKTYAPYTSTNVYFDGVSTYNYGIGFIDANTYTAALSCDVTDDPEIADAIDFLQAKNVVIPTSKTAVSLNFTE
ncbi:DUF4382 domain-containing protein [Rheinheimera sp. UJ63]|uniref:DUF4382 domain-containing protein n=1 Tax=Rheinheimera sp. UJ63 TaxID=2910157 RepID=UPI001F25AE4E|nr:DUF4382 domain-containing protein [Rheinheimera sp. UJ63]MCF4009700.1 DUF4382 domain-containing protein [Rheinheimera sp. UJ63]